MRGTRSNTSFFYSLTLALSRREREFLYSQWLKLRLGCCVALVLLWASSPLVSRAEQEYQSPAVHLFSEDSASEHWELTARLDSGHLLFAEFMITNIGFGDRNATVFGHVVTPQGKSYRFSNGRTESNWTLSSDRLRMEIGSSTLDLHAPLYRVQVNKRKVRVDLRFRPDEAFVPARSLSRTGYTLETLALGAPVEGTLWVKGMEEPLVVKGLLTATHSWMTEAGSTLVLRRIEFFSFDENMALYGIDLTTPRGERARWVLVKPDGTRGYSVEQSDLALQGEDKTTNTPGYTVPQTLDLKSEHIEGQIHVAPVVLRADPLADLPPPVRFLVSVLLDFRPQRVWASSSFSLSFRPTNGSVPVHRQGTGVTAVTFLNPLPADARFATQHSE